jgi:REP element-mobilizing transposase RayT
MVNENNDSNSTSLGGVKWHSRGYLPHYDTPGEPQMLTFRLHDSLPQAVLADLTEELQTVERRELNRKRCLRIEELLDQGIGKCYLSVPTIAQVTAQAIQHFHGQKYLLHAWVVMPNHVHVLLTPAKENPMPSIIHSWKSFTANQANKILGRQGSFWQREYFDRKIRNEKHFENAIVYIHNNPLKAGLCEAPEEWRFSSAYLR